MVNKKIDFNAGVESFNIEYKKGFTFKHFLIISLFICVFLIAFLFASIMVYSINETLMCEKMGLNLSLVNDLNLCNDFFAGWNQTSVTNNTKYFNSTNVIYLNSTASAPDIVIEKSIDNNSYSEKEMNLLIKYALLNSSLQQPKSTSQDDWLNDIMKLMMMKQLGLNTSKSSSESSFDYDKLDELIKKSVNDRFSSLSSQSVPTSSNSSNFNFMYLGFAGAFGVLGFVGFKKGWFDKKKESVVNPIISQDSLNSSIKEQNSIFK